MFFGRAHDLPAAVPSNTSAQSDALEHQPLQLHDGVSPSSLAPLVIVVLYIASRGWCATGDFIFDFLVIGDLVECIPSVLAVYLSLGISP